MAEARKTCAGACERSSTTATSIGLRAIGASGDIVSAPFYKLEGRKYPRLQIMTIADALHGAKPAIPLVDTGAAFKKAAKEAPSQGKLAF
jgi:hypothetical protein